MIINYLFDFPKIESIRDLANEIKLSENLIYNLTNNTDKFYKHVKKRKSSGGYRDLYCPSRKLKAVQAWILRNILEIIPLENSATAFRKGLNIKDNTEMHKNNKFIVCLDIKNFFDNIQRKWVYNLFLNLGYSKHVSLLFTNLCTYKGHLPQGGVTSPCLSNILLKRFDRRIAGYAGARNITYTRYADDITLSKNEPAILIKSINFIKKIINDEGFEINKNKTRILRPGSRREITGLIITDNNRISIGRKRKRKLRAEIHHYMYEKKEVWEDHKKLKNHLEGWMNFIKSVDEKAYNQLKNYWQNLYKEINKKEIAISKEEIIN